MGQAAWVLAGYHEEEKQREKEEGQVGVQHYEPAKYPIEVKVEQGVRAHHEE